MRNAAVLATGIVLSTSALCFAQSVGMVQPVGVSDFLKLPRDLQAVYVGGIIEGMAFMAYSYAPSDYPVWVQCVRSKTLGRTTDDVVAFIRQTPNFNEGVAGALAQMLGKRCKH